MFVLRFIHVAFFLLQLFLIFLFKFVYLLNDLVFDGAEKFLDFLEFDLGMKSVGDRL